MLALPDSVILGEYCSLCASMVICMRVPSIYVCETCICFVSVIVYVRIVIGLLVIELLGFYPIDPYPLLLLYICIVSPLL